MTTQHFNALTEAEAERLAILCEECAEVQQIVCKILRHGYDSDNNGKLPETNRQMLARELGDLLHAANRLFSADDVNGFEVSARAASRAEHVKPYLHHQDAAAARPTGGGDE